MTEVPNAILWIAAVGLIIQTVLVAALVISILILIGKINQLVSKVKEMADPLKDAATSLGATVSTFSNSLLRPLATAAGVFAGFRRGAGSFGRKRKR